MKRNDRKYGLFVSGTRVLYTAFYAAIVFCSCMNLNPFLFEGENVGSYRFDEYDGKKECADALDSLGKIDMSTVHEVTIVSGDERIAGVFVATATSFDSTDTVILYFHGNAMHLDYYWPRTRLLAATGYPVLAIDYRGYGKSTGKSTESGIYEDGFSALRYLREHCGNPKVAVYAFSLGSLVGCEIASKDPTGSVIALILEAPIGSMETIVQDATYIDMPGPWVTTFEGKNTEKIKNVLVPFLWLHGTGDRTLPLETNGKKVFENYHGDAGYCAIVEGAEHGNIPRTIGYGRYIKGISDFIRGNAANNPLFSSSFDK